MPSLELESPWDREFNRFDGYNRGSALVNESCVDMAAYMARIVSHYTAGGHTDSCGHWHESGFHYVSSLAFSGVRT